MGRANHAGCNSGTGSAHLDFTQPKTLSWWKAKVTETLLDYGIIGTWNDNNEFEIWTDKALARGFGQTVPPVRASLCKVF